MCPEYAKEIFDYLKQREVSQTKSQLPHFRRNLRLFLGIFFFFFPEKDILLYSESESHLCVWLPAGEVCPL